MAIKRYSGDRFTGLSTDTKPSNILSGAQFTEIDSGKIFFFDGTQWAESTVELPIANDAPTDGGQYARKNGAWEIVDHPITYTHPTGFNSTPPNPLTGATVISKVLVNGEGHVTGIETRELTFDDLPATPSVVGGDGVVVSVESNGDYLVNVELSNTSGLEINGLSQLSHKLKAQGGLTVDVDGLSVDPSIAGDNLTWSNGQLHAPVSYTHPTLTSRDVEVSHNPSAEHISHITVNTDGHVTGVGKAKLPLGAIDDIDNYSRIAPLSPDVYGDLVVPLKYIPRSAKSSMVVDTIADRDAIGSEHRFEGLRVHVIDATTDPAVDVGSAGYILRSGLGNTAWVLAYEEESLNLTIPVSEGNAGTIQLSDGLGNFSSTPDFSFHTAAKRLDMTGGLLKKEGGTVPTVNPDESYSYVTTEVVGTDTITRVLERLADGTDVIVASYVTAN